MHRILTNPAYGGAYAYGKNGTFNAIRRGKAATGESGAKARTEWLALIPNTHEGYISWERFEEIQRAIGGNVRDRGSPVLSNKARRYCPDCCAVGVAVANSPCNTREGSKMSSAIVVFAAFWTMVSPNASRSGDERG